MALANPCPLTTSTSIMKRPLSVILANPRGFCAGVDRAIRIVELSLERFGAPVYVRHEIVHNRYVVRSLEAKGAIFVDELDEVPSDRPVIFSAHGVPKDIPAEAERRQMIYVDATCPLVSKVHREAERQSSSGKHLFLIGHAGHPEVIGTLGQLEPGAISLVETVEDVAKITPPDGAELAYITQTTLSVDDTADIVAALAARFPDIAAPRADDICYATTNRQEAVKAIAPRCDLLLVIGAPNSSNSVRLVEVAERAGAPSHLVQSAADLDMAWFEGIETVGMTAGASAPEVLVEDVLTVLREHFELTIETVQTRIEDVTFKLPRALSA